MNALVHDCDLATHLWLANQLELHETWFDTRVEHFATALDSWERYRVPDRPLVPALQALRIDSERIRAEILRQLRDAAAEHRSRMDARRRAEANALDDWLMENQRWMAQAVQFRHARQLLRFDNPEAFPIPATICVGLRLLPEQLGLAVDSVVLRVPLLATEQAAAPLDGWEASQEYQSRLMRSATTCFGSLELLAPYVESVELDSVKLHRRHMPAMP